MIIIKPANQMTLLKESDPTADLKKVKDLIGEAMKICNSHNWKRAKGFLSQAYAALADVD